METLNVIGICGSLRKDSYNRGLLRAAQELAPKEMHIEIADISGIPLLNEDVATSGDPPAVGQLKSALDDADGILFATPEYNYGMSGVMKNVFDWLSLPPGQSVLLAKPTAMLGASKGMGGTIRAQLQLRHSCGLNAMHVMAQPELFVGFASQKSEESGNLVDKETRVELSQFLAAFADWIGKTKNLGVPNWKVEGARYGA
jgi:chromate reductase, NAD(P)H dehydrogenase (quinone)